MPSKCSGFFVGMSVACATPSSRVNNSTGLVSTLKSPSPLSRSTPSHSVSEVFSEGHNGQNASMLVPAMSGILTSQRTAESRSLAGMTAVPSRQRRRRAPSVRQTRFSPRPDASISSETKTSNFSSSSSGGVTPRTSVHQTSNGASSSDGSGALGPAALRRLARTMSSEARAMEETCSTPTTAEAPARKAIIERIPSPLPTSNTRIGAFSPLRLRTAAISARNAASYRSCRAPSRNISKYQSDNTMYPKGASSELAQSQSTQQLPKPRRAETPATGSPARMVRPPVSHWP
mmetsp:Transcript_43997/g.141052  ORF Transcript_43997/g.141052 Transcript_43997/m.141052 type:complete len:290 (+) Transcript_43997:613-1482(+)